MIGAVVKYGPEKYEMLAGTRIKGNERKREF
jgi:hypothetical protein